MPGGCVRQPGDLDGSIPGVRDSLERPAQVLRGVEAHGVQLEGDLVGSHPRTIGHREAFRMP